MSTTDKEQNESSLSELHALLITTNDDYLEGKLSPAERRALIYLVDRSLSRIGLSWDDMDAYERQASTK